MQAVLQYLEDHQNDFRAEFEEFLRIESVSADPARAGEVQRAAQWVRDRLERAGMRHATIHETEGHPIVTADWLDAEDAPTLLVYGHYDVQPEDPVDLWSSPPFEPTERDGKLFARGSADDKGQLILYIQAVEAWLETHKKLPMNVKVIFEGEEEIGSENLSTFLTSHAEELSCDYTAISDSGMFGEDFPTVTIGLRGLVYAQLDIETAKTDLHSGSFGGAVPNAANVACAIVAKLKDDKGRIAIPGFYDGILPISQVEKDSFERLPFDVEEFKKSIGIDATPGEEGYSVLERLWTRPTLDVNGLLSGYVVEGAKTVIPEKSMVKLSMRLVPGQEPKKIEQALVDYVEQIKPEGSRVNVQLMHSGEAFLADPEDAAFKPAFDAACRALKAGFNAEPVVTREGGSIPIVNEFSQVLGCPVLLLGFGLPDMNAHAPNESIHLGVAERGRRSLAHLFGELMK